MFLAKYLHFDYDNEQKDFYSLRPVLGPCLTIA